MAEVSKPTQQFVNIREIRKGIVYLRDGGLRQILIVGGVNFDLKSESEQNMILGSFQNFLNTLDFSVQFFVHSRKTNIDKYLEKIQERKEIEQNALLKIQIEEYIQFIKAFVQQNAIISKAFFVVVPYEPIALVNRAQGIFGFFKKSKSTAEEKTSAEHDREQLGHRVDQVISGLEQVGLRVAPLTDEALTELFYNLYNPQLVEKKGLEVAKR